MCNVYKYIDIHIYLTSFSQDQPKPIKANSVSKILAAVYMSSVLFFKKIIKRYSTPYKMFSCCFHRSSDIKQLLIFPI